MNVELFKPTNTRLKKYIECYYILTHNKGDNKTAYLTFPSMFSIVSTVANTNVKQIENKIYVSQSTKQNFISDLVAKFSSPLLIEYEGNIKEITIYFKPLGLNAFLDNTLNEYEGDNPYEFIPFNDYQKNLLHILSLKTVESIKSELEKYWLSKLKGFNNHKLQNCVDDIIANPDLAISTIARNNNLSHKALIQNFKKHLCKTPTEFKKVVRFRKAMANKKSNSLTEVSYLASYFDQAHMIKDFNDLTNHNPKDFFKNLFIQDEKINWIFLQR